MDSSGRPADEAPTVFELKQLSHEGLDRAHLRAVHYRLLNQPRLAESICRDVLAVNSGHREARITLVLCLCDQFGHPGAPPVRDVLALSTALEGDYDRSYYSGLVCERRATAFLEKAAPGCGPMAYDWFRRAMSHYEAAEAVREPGDDDAILRWNTCARILNSRKDVRPRVDNAPPAMLE